MIADALPDELPDDLPDEPMTTSIMNSVKQLGGIAFYPVVLGAAMAAGLWAVSGDASPMPFLALTSISVVAVTALCERLLPCRADWNVTGPDSKVDALHLMVSNIGAPQLYRFLFVLAGAPLAAMLAKAIGFDLWPRSWPLWASALLALLIAELGQYWAHRLAHEHASLWRLHVVHHSSTRLYWMNAGRDHPLGVLLLYSSELVPLILLGCDARTLSLFTLFTATNGVLKHSNVNVRLGPLNWIFSMAELHRWHHAKDPREGNVNFGANLILWDVVFGTRSHPSPLPPQELGLSERPNFPTGYLAQLLVPFRRSGDA